MLFRILGISPTVVFNGRPNTYHENEDSFLAPSLKQTINVIQSQAVSFDGKAVDYVAITNSAIYRDFQAELTPRLRNFDPMTFKINDERLAFWINLYNVLEIDSVI